MKTIRLLEQVGLTEDDRKKLTRDLETLEGFERVLRGWAAFPRTFRSKRSLLAEVVALEEMGRELVRGILPAEVNLARFGFRFAAVTRGVLLYVEVTEPDLPPKACPELEALSELDI